MQTRTILAVVLSILVFLVFTYLGDKFKTKPPPEKPAPQTVEPREPAKPTEPVKPAPPSKVPVTKAPVPVPKAKPERAARDVVVETPLYRAVFTERGASLKSFQLKKYKQKLPIDTWWKLPWNIPFVSFEIEFFQDTNKSEASPKELVTDPYNPELPLSLTWEGRTQSIPATLFYEADTPSLTLKAGDTGTLTFQGVTSEGQVITKTYRFKANTYAFDLKAAIANRSSQKMEGDLRLALTGKSTAVKGQWGLVASVENDLETFKPGKLKEPKTFTSKVEWAGLDELYFLTVAVPTGVPRIQATLAEPKQNQLKASLGLQETLAAGKEIQLAYALYFGPRDTVDLKAANVGLEGVVDFGWFDWLARPFLHVITWLNGYIHNYGWTLIIFTILTRLVLLYPNHKSIVSMKAMQKIQPRVTEIREKYKDDKQAMNRELMTLYRTFKVNPLGGCLPMALQLPVFLALYNLLLYSIEFRHASFIPTLPFTNIVWLADLSAKDPLLITPIIMGLSMFIQQKMSPPPGDPAQAKMMMFLPLIFTVLFLNFAAGLVVYWLVNNVLAIIQQYITDKYIRMP